MTGAMNRVIRRPDDRPPAHPGRGAPSKPRRAALLIGLLVLGWLVCTLLSFLDFATTEADGSSFSSNINRLSGFLVWQVAAVFLAALAFVAGWMQPQGLAPLTRRLTRLPLFLSAFLWVLIVVAGIALFLLDRIQNPIQ